MFSRMQLLAGADTVNSRFNVKCGNPSLLIPNGEISGFDHAAHPVIIHESGELICDNFQWGLVPPDWRKKPEDIWNHTISAKLEYINKRYAWQKVSCNRCLVPATAYYEYHWNDPKGHSKTKYLIKNKTAELFALAGLFSLWQSPNGVSLKTFAVCTTEANEIMEFVHNKDAEKNYHRMPIMINKGDENAWLDTTIPFGDFAFPNYKPSLVAEPVTKNQPAQQKLF